MRPLRIALAATLASVVLVPTAAGDHDTSAPVVSYTLSGTLGTNGWYRTNVTINWSVSEPQGLTSTSGCEIAQLVAVEGSSSHTCTATSHGGTTSSTATLKLDKTLPSVPVGTAARSPDSNGWFNHAVSVNFSGTDAVSGIDSCSGGLYGGPDSATATLAGTCRDRAGNTSSGAFALAYDSTDPTPTAATSRAPDANGWFNHALTVSFAQAPGDLSGPGSCSAAVSYGGPDSASVSRSGTCTDRAGNTSNPVALTFDYDSTAPQALAAPSRAPDANGWYNRSLTVSFAQAPGDLSGPSSCSAPASYNGPDTASVSRSGTCTDAAGNTSAAATETFKYDATAPSGVAGSLARTPDANGWYNHPVALNMTGTDATSGIASCGSASYAGPDSATASVAGACTDRAGNASVSVSASFKYDATAPGVTAAPARQPDSNGWFSRPVAIVASGSDPVSGVASCTAPTYSGPDSAGATVGATCTDNAGNASAATVATLKYDTGAPVVSASADRPPDARGWYRRPLTVSFAGSDALSGITSCTAPARYEGPDRGTVAVVGTCRDGAGNAAEATREFRYDATAPKLSRLTARGEKKLVRLGWERSADAVVVELVRRPGVSGARSTVVYRGVGRSFVDRTVRNGVRYRYELGVGDEAGNRAEAAVTVTPRPPLYRPALGALVRPPLVLAWDAVEGARFYNVQLLRDGVKVLSAWPRAATLRLGRTLRYRGKERTLTPGRYRWFVWAALGTRERPSFGRALGSSSFVVR